ncbi:MAG: zf-TFIIB domain-containing protein [Rhodoglobus sp.]
MKCPTDSTTLVMSERGGVEIDYCPECRGVWLDRGELDKIIDRAEAELTSSTPTPRATSQPTAVPRYQEPRYGDGQYGERDNSRGYGRRDEYRGKKKESWISNLFD